MTSIALPRCTPPALLALLALLCSPACGGGGGGGESQDAGREALYAPASAYLAGPETQHTLHYTDRAGLTRTFEIETRFPAGAPEPLPVVIWSHGGASGLEKPGGVGVAWSEHLVAAGYLVVAIAHRPRVDDGITDERTPLCTALGFDAQDCATFKHLSWDRPNDIARVIDWLERQVGGPWAGRVDLTRIAHAGHSAGGGAALMIAGATREFAGVARSLADPRVRACVSCSPQGPGDDGFTEASFATVNRPHLSLTGKGDDTGGTVAENRRLGFELMQPGNRYRGWIDEESARHNTFNGEPDKCESFGGTPARCAEHVAWITALALAFLDAHVRDVPAARAYLDSPAPEGWGGPAFQWSRR